MNVSMLAKLTIKMSSLELVGRFCKVLSFKSLAKSKP